MAITYNAALNRPAYQSSVYAGEASLGPFTADRANDGSRHTHYNTGTKCAVTQATAKQWWAVDLGQPMTIYKVYLTSSDKTSTKPNITSLELVQRLTFDLASSFDLRHRHKAVFSCLQKCMYDSWSEANKYGR